MIIVNFISSCLFSVEEKFHLFIHCVSMKLK